MRALAGECAKNAASIMASGRSEGGVVIIVRSVKILSIKITHSACTFNYPLNKGKGAIYPHLLIKIPELRGPECLCAQGFQIRNSITSHIVPVILNSSHGEHPSSIVAPF